MCTPRQGVMIKVAEHSDTNMSMNFGKSVGKLDYVTNGCIILTFELRSKPLCPGIRLHPTNFLSLN